MHLRHLFSSRLRGSLLLGSLLVASSFSTQAAEEMLRKAVGKGAYEMAYSQQENALWLATSQSRKLDKGGVVYRLDPVTGQLCYIVFKLRVIFAVSLIGSDVPERLVEMIFGVALAVETFIAEA
mgnify:CR=1 FL=1